jgi:hypothetical protein
MMDIDDGEESFTPISRPQKKNPKKKGKEKRKERG